MGSAVTETPHFGGEKHYCAILRSEEEWRDCVAAFARDALDRNDLLVYFHHHHTREQVLAALSDLPHADEALHSGQLLILTAGEGYYPSDSVDPQDAVRRWTQMLEQALADGYAGLSVTGEASFATTPVAGVSRLVEYEALVETALQGRACTLLCQYDTRCLPPDIVTEALTLHQHVMTGGRIHLSRYYIPPDKFLSANRAESVLQSRLDSLQAWTEEEDALRASEERYRLIADYSYDWQTLLIPDGEVLYVSPSCERITGYTAAEFMADARLMDQIIHPDDLPRWREHVEQAVDSQEALWVEFRIIARDGEARWIRHHCQPAYADDGTPTGRRASNREATLRQRVEQELVETNGLLQTILDQAPTAIVVLDCDGTVRLWSDGARDMFGWEAQEVIGTPNPLIPTDKAQVYARIREAISHGDSFSAEIPCTTKDGRVIETAMSVTGVRDSRGEVVALLGMLSDITQRRRTEDERERLLVQVDQEREQFRAIFESAGVGIGLTDLEGRYTQANRALLDMLGYTADEMLGLSVRDVTHPDQGENFSRLGGQLRAGDTDGFEIEKRYIRKDGETIWANLIVRLIRDAQGQPLQIVGMVEDISARKQAAAVNERLTAELEAIFASLTDAVAVYDTNWNLIRANDNARYYVGQDLAELHLSEVAQRLQIRTPDGEPFPFECWPDRAALSRNRVIELPLLITTASGEVRRVSASATALREDGRPVAVVLSWHDVTALDQATEEARKRAAEFEAVFSAIADAVSICAADGRLLYCNEAAQRMLRYDDEPVYEKRITRCEYRRGDGTPYCFEDLPLTRSLGGEVVTGELVELAWPDGTSTWVNSSAAPLRSPDGAIYGAVLTNTDLTKLRLAQHALALSEQRYRNVGELIPFGVWATDANGRPTYISQSFLQMTGRTLEEIQGDWLALHPEADREAVAGDWLQAVQTGSFWDRELDVLGADGQVRTTLARGVPIYSEGGQIASWVGLNLDITTRKRDEKELRRHRDHLEDLVTQRTSELVTYHERLRALASELSLAEERERRRIATVIHDDVAQTLAFMKMQVASLRTSTDVELLREGHRHLESLLNEAIQSARRITMQLSPPVLYRMGFGPAMQWLGSQMQATYGYEVDVTVTEEPLPLSDDISVTLFQAARELLTNAAKYAQAKQVVIVVKRGGDSVEVIVSDDGVGFDPAQVQVTDSGGFGLFNIGERLAWMDGSLDVQSAPGAGARFVLRAPLSELA